MKDHTAKTSSWLPHVIQSAIAASITSAILLSIGVFDQYKKHFNGDFAQYLQPGGMYAAPADLEEHGFAATRFTEGSGWDGQFYYYLANDPFLQKDTVEHLDGPKLRASRVGFPLLVYLCSKLLFQSWVSPLFYFGCSFVVILGATYGLGRTLRATDNTALLAMLWGVSGATLYTLLFGFTDGATDALVIIALSALFFQYRWVYAIAISFACISRENFILVPFFVGLVLLLGDLMNIKSARNIGEWLLRQLQLQWVNFVPAAVFLIYKYLLAQKFGAAAIESSDFIGFPFAASLYFLSGGYLSFLSELDGGDFHVPKFSWYQAIGLSFYVGICLIGLGVLGHKLFVKGKEALHSRSVVDFQTVGVLAGLLVTVLLYASYGAGQVWAPIGYVKSSGFIAAAICLGYAYTRTRVPLYVPISAITMNCFYIYVTWKMWI